MHWYTWMILSGNKQFMDSIPNQIKKRFKVSKDVSDNFTYTGMQVRTDIKGNIFLNQNKYAEELVDIPEGIEHTIKDEAAKTLIRKSVGKLLYLNLTRPDLAFRTNYLSRDTPDRTLADRVKEARQLIKDARSVKVELKLQSIGALDKIGLECYADASFANAELGVRSTGGTLILMKSSEDASGNCSPIYWSSRQIPRV